MAGARPHGADRLPNDANASGQLKISQAQDSWKHKMAQLLTGQIDELHKSQADSKVGRCIHS
jgi:hypothetical protein